MVLFRYGCLGFTNNTKHTNNKKHTKQSHICSFCVLFGFAGKCWCFLVSCWGACVCCFGVDVFIYQQQHETLIQQQNKVNTNNTHRTTNNNTNLACFCLLSVCCVFVVVFDATFLVFGFCLPRYGYNSKTCFVVVFLCVCLVLCCCGFLFCCFVLLLSFVVRVLFLFKVAGGGGGVSVWFCVVPTTTQNQQITKT